MNSEASGENSAKTKISVGVFGIPINAAGQFLLTQRNAPDSPATHQKWQFAGGGLEHGETPEQTLVREFQEELAVTPKILFPHPIVTSYTWPDSHLIILMYIVNIGDQLPQNLHDDETLAWKWYEFAEAQQLESLPNIPEILTKAQQLISAQKLV